MGQLTEEELGQLNEHLAQCESCRDLVEEYKQIALLDLPAVNIDRSGDEHSEVFGASTMSRLFNATVESAKMELRVEQTSQNGASEKVPIVSINHARCPIPLSTRIAKIRRPLLAACGCAAAASLLAVVFIKDIHYRRPLTSATHPASASLNSSLQNGRGLTQPDERSSGGRDWGAEYQSLSIELLAERKQAHEKEAALISANHEINQLTEKTISLESQLEQEKQFLADRTSDLSVADAKLAKQTDTSADLEAQLKEVSNRLTVQRKELARLEEVAMQGPVRVPVSDSSAFDTDARELFGARDLHIVDVYDVDHSGNPSRTYGRVYYVNRKLLMFYAFDLNSKQREHKPVAFQAWGFRQPHSAAPENLGLFIMDDAQLDRWVLRVADPKILASIDTLFVTVEPPGGSTVPKGNPLLLASLSGPPNHP